MCSPQAVEKASPTTSPFSNTSAHIGTRRRTSSKERRLLNADPETATLQLPGWGLEAAHSRLEKRNFVGLGIVDTHGIDPGQDSTFPVHIATFSEGKHGMENIASLASVHPARMTVFIGAPKHEGGPGEPARVLAVAWA